MRLFSLFAACYGYPLAIYQCPNLVAFQASHSLAIVCPFSEVPPAFIWHGYELQASSGTSSPPQRDDLASLLSHASLVPSAQGSTLGHDPPLVAAATWTSSAAISSVSLGARPPPRATSAHPDPDGVNVPPLFMGGTGGPRFFGRSSSSYGYLSH